MGIEKESYSIAGTFVDFPDDSSYSTIVFVHGCSHNCDGCQNPEFQKHVKFNPKELVDDIISFSKEIYTDKVVLSGGDPLMEENIKDTEIVVSKLKEYGFSVCIYTGHSINFVRKNFHSPFDFIKCGVYNKGMSRPFKKDNSSFVLASSNQDFFNGNFEKISNNGEIKWRNV